MDFGGEGTVPGIGETVGKPGTSAAKRVDKGSIALALSPPPARIASTSCV